MSDIEAIFYGHRMHGKSALLSRVQQAMAAFDWAARLLGHPTGWDQDPVSVDFTTWRPSWMGPLPVQSAPLTEAKLLAAFELAEAAPLRPLIEVISPAEARRRYGRTL